MLRDTGFLGPDVLAVHCIHMDAAEIAIWKEHDVKVYLHQNRDEVESLEVLDTDDDALTRVYLEGLDEARARAVFY